MNIYHRNKKLSTEVFGDLRSESSEVAVLHEPPALHAKVVLYKVRQSTLFEPVANSLPCAHECMYVSMYVCMNLCFLY